MGALATGADLPNAFPYLIAVERLAAAAVPLRTGMTVLALYALVYCLPCLLLLASRLLWGGPVSTWLQRLHQRFGAGDQQPRSLPAALGLWVAAVIAATVATTV